MDHFCYLCFVFVMLSCLFVQPCGHLLGKDHPLGSLVCDIFLCFSTFPCGVLILDCIDSCYLPSYLL